jgi:alpha-glucoside transport system permease protein
VIFLTLFTVGIGLVIAVLVDRVRYESIAKSIIFVPLAISMTAAGVIWRFMFDYQSPGSPQTGTMNALIGTVGLGPVSWLQVETLGFNTILLIVVMAWMWTGFAMVILSAALKGISAELLEAARVDGATEWRVFQHIVFPLLLPTIAVVSTTIIITALKAFDIDYVMTNGNFGTDVIANRMIKEMFTFGQFGHGSALAVILLLAIVPIMALNINRFRAQEAIR